MFHRIERNRDARTLLAPLCAALLLVAFGIAACGAATPSAQMAPATAAPAAQSMGAPAATVVAQAPAARSSSGSGQPNLIVPTDRKIIKTSQLSMIVDSTSVALGRITQYSADVGGYVVSSHTFAEGSSTGGQVTIAVPVDRFEEALNLVRKVAQTITSDTTSSSDVSDQYVDLQARQKNLEATAERIRQFLEKAATVDEALKVNQQLSDVEGQIEQIKGQLNALNARTSFSTIAVEMHEPRPTPTPTATPTPPGWHPDQTFSSAMTVQTNLLHALGDILIWVGVVLIPYAVVAGLGLAIVSWFIRRFVKPIPPRVS